MRVAPSPSLGAKGSISSRRGATEGPVSRGSPPRAQKHQSPPSFRLAGVAASRAVRRQSIGGQCPGECPLLAARRGFLKPRSGKFPSHRILPTPLARPRPDPWHVTVCAVLPPRRAVDEQVPVAKPFLASPSVPPDTCASDDPGGRGLPVSIHRCACNAGDLRPRYFLARVCPLPFGSLNGSLDLASQVLPWLSRSKPLLQFGPLALPRLVRDCHPTGRLPSFRALPGILSAAYASFPLTGCRRVLRNATTY